MKTERAFGSIAGDIELHLTVVKASLLLDAIRFPKCMFRISQRNRNRRKEASYMAMMVCVRCEDLRYTDTRVDEQARRPGPDTPLTP